MALAVSGSTVYVGGLFTSVGGQARNYLAALDAATGNVTSWNPNANGSVYALAVSGSTVYVGGDFTSVGGQARNSPRSHRCRHRCCYQPGTPMPMALSRRWR
ncbi:MAG: hypothetical protein KatS3mg061_0536 [Dehalococcoidia bacterium]|nr:MAG: hypothetical protein KatS3mg061_0536 [Dehalococcoidia bacterium]